MASVQRMPAEAYRLLRLCSRISTAALTLENEHIRTADDNMRPDADMPASETFLPPSDDFAPPSEYFTPPAEYDTAHDERSMEEYMLTPLRDGERHLHGYIASLCNALSDSVRIYYKQAIPSALSDIEQIYCEIEQTAPPAKAIDGITLLNAQLNVQNDIEALHSALDKHRHHFDAEEANLWLIGLRTCHRQLANNQEITR